ncbi:MAG TPA: cbb3-type cytochrome c oxidase N-terminal domain-containing protein [Phycisphaerae bacterium]|nr:cbb3-type cytochrome c oxidase N-terminal domain-containing protein [Phycisphaerae bacterium]
MSGIPSEQPTSGVDVLLEHNYDGIQEYDNPTPGWWWWIFIGTFAFSVVYFIFFQFSPVSWTIHESYDVATAELLRRQFGDLRLEPDEATILRYANDPEWLLVGRSVFQGRCTQCHGRNGEGLVGPNLTDDHYKNVKKAADIAHVIANGAANGAMPAHKNQLHPNEIVLTASYIASLRGLNLPGRAPEGEIIPPWPAPPTPPQPDRAPGEPR